MQVLEVCFYDPHVTTKTFDVFGGVDGFDGLFVVLMKDQHRLWEVVEVLVVVIGS